MPRISAQARQAAQQILGEQQKLLGRVTNERAAARLRKLYDQAAAELEGKLARVRGGRTMTVGQHRQMLHQLRLFGVQMPVRMAEGLGQVAHETQRTALNSLAKGIQAVERTFKGAATPLPLAEASRFAGVIDRRKTSLMRMHQSSMANYGTRIVGKMENQLAVSLASGETQMDAIDRITKTADLEWWQGERIVRTETAWAYNATHHDGIVEAARELPDMMARWSEHVDDGGAPMDDRVGDDSLAMHGQIAKPGEAFTMPPTTPDGKVIHRSLVGRSWQFPPNRPNDRAIVQPWRPHWGIDGWVWRGGARVPFAP